MAQLTGLWEDRMEQRNMLKEERCSELRMHLTDKGYKVHLFTIEVGALLVGLMGRFSYTFLKKSRRWTIC